MAVFVSRRGFIYLILGGTLGALGVTGVVKNLNETSDTNIRELLSAYALRLKSAHFDLPSQHDLDSIEARLLARGWDNVFSEDDLNNRISDIIRDDFSGNRVVEIEGWILSEFEKDLIDYSALIKQRNGIMLIEQESNFETAEITEFVHINDWGPRSTCVGMPFNQQTDGHSSIWISLDSYIGRLVVYMGGIAIPTTMAPGVVTTKIDGKVLTQLISNAGVKDVTIYDPARNIKQKIGMFEIHDRVIPAVTEAGVISTNFGKIEDWGPESLPILQFEGKDKIALWIKTQCAPRDAIILMGDIPLKTTVGPALVTGLFSDLKSKPSIGGHAVWLYSRQSQEKIKVGVINISN